MGLDYVQHRDDKHAHWDLSIADTRQNAQQARAVTLSKQVIDKGNGPLGEFVEKRVGHVVVIVLARANKHVLDKMVPQRADKWRGFHKVVPRIHDGHNFHL